jgi:hypothetical protein
MIHGRCLCGAVTFRVEPPLRDVIACHCTQCRKSSGHFWAATSAPMDRIHLDRTDSLTWFQSSDTARRGFCAVCGSSLFWEPVGEGRLAIAAGALDGDTGVTLTKHIFCAEKGDYYDIADDLPQIARW